MNRLERHRPSIIAIGYTVVALLILLAAWNPSIGSRPGPVDLLLLLDESNSIEPEHNEQLWQAFVQQARTLPSGSRISLIRFADRAALEVPWLSTQDEAFLTLLANKRLPRHRYLDLGASALIPALEHAVRYSTAAGHSAIIMSSDGVDSVATDQSIFPIDIKNPGLSLFLHRADGRHLGNQLSIESINLPARALPWQVLPVSVSIRSGVASSGALEVRVNELSVDRQPVSLQQGETKVIHLQLLADQSDRQRLDFITRDEQGNITDHLRRVIDRRGQPQLLYIGNNSADTKLTSLQHSNWHITRIAPHRLPAQPSYFGQFDIILIDDIAASDIAPEITKNMQRAVQRLGTGLAVVGGPHSFGSGGYRHSELEQMLPVLAESSRPLPGSAFLFLVDKSGSMEAVSRGQNRLADALRAIGESAKSLQSGDEIALLSFDRETKVLLPLAAHADPVTALNRPWELQPSGGTHLAPALKQAIQHLSNSQSMQRFLILVSDGHVDDSDMAPIKKALQQANIQLIALAVGSNADLSTLQELSQINDGQLLRIDDSAELPFFIRQQLESRQHSWSRAMVTPQLQLAAPFIDLQSKSWLALPGYQVTRSKPAARVYLTTDDGDPLLAITDYGAGRVAALPGGLPEALPEQNLLSRLLGWLNSRQTNPWLGLSHRYLSGELSLQVDAVDPGNNWHPPSEARVTLTDPEGISRSQSLDAVAPGRFSGVIKTALAGIYRIKIEVADQQLGVTAYLANDTENRYQTMPSWLEHALSSNTIQPWDKGSLDRLLSSSSSQISMRSLWLLLAFIGYLMLMLFERSTAYRAIKKALFSLRTLVRRA